MSKHTHVRVQLFSCAHIFCLSAFTDGLFDYFNAQPNLWHVYRSWPQPLREKPHEGSLHMNSRVPCVRHGGCGRMYVWIARKIPYVRPRYCRHTNTWTTFPYIRIPGCGLHAITCQQRFSHKKSKLTQNQKKQLNVLSGFWVFVQRVACWASMWELKAANMIRTYRFWDCTSCCARRAVATRTAMCTNVGMYGSIPRAPYAEIVHVVSLLASTCPW
jgi:hypothetical protein